MSNFKICDVTLTTYRFDVFNLNWDKYRLIFPKCLETMMAATVLEIAPVKLIKNQTILKLPFYRI